MTIGDIAIDWTHGETIWVGTGENNSSRSSYAGNGIYRSTDGGETWEHRGLQGTQRTGRIVLHPDNPQVLWVAAAGALYSPNPERGVYKSSDGGASWEKVLFVDDETGAIDLIIDAKPDARGEIKDIIESAMIAYSPDLEPDYSIKYFVRYYAPRWERIAALSEGAGWTRSGRMLLFEFMHGER